MKFGNRQNICHMGLTNKVDKIKGLRWEIMPSIKREKEQGREREWDACNKKFEKICCGTRNERCDLYK